MGGEALGALVLGLVGFLFSILLAFLGKKLAVEEDPLVAQILKLLPGVNCGACGFSGCKAFAQMMVKRREFSICRPAGEEVNSQIAKILGVEVLASSDSRKAVVRCGASREEKKISTQYRGFFSCRFLQVVGGGIDCKYGCLGGGDCVEICPSGAISIKDGRAVVDIKKCIGCQRCVKVCPRNLFELVPARNKSIYFVACNNPEKAGYVRGVCKKGCISCGLCTKVENSPFYLKENLSFIDYKKAKDDSALSLAKEKCPTHCIDEIILKSD